MAMGLRPAASGEDEFGDVYAPVAEINVTPMVDVMLVLLIIFMVTAPLMVSGVPVNLPDSAAATPAETPDPVVVSVDDTGGVFLGESAVTMETLVRALIDLYERDPDATVQVRGDRQIRYGQIMEVVDAIGVAGFTKVSLISRPQPGSAASD